MTDTPEISPEARTALQSQATELRRTLKRAMDLAPADTLAVAIMPVLETLGWDPRDPRQVRRTGADGARLMSGGRTVLRLTALPAGAPLPQGLTGLDEEEAEWIVVSNGLDWALFNRANTTRPFRTASLADTAGTRAAVDVLGLLGRDTFRPDSLMEAWMSEAVDGDVAHALVRHLDGSDALLAALETGLREKGITLGRDEIQGALTRLSVTVDAPQATESASAETTRDSAPAERAKPGPKPGKAKPGPKPGKATTAGTGRKRGRPPKNRPAEPAETPAAAPAPVAAETVSETTAPAAPAAAAEAPLPTSPSEMTWPRGATHVMHRKKTIAFGKVDTTTGNVRLLPGSILALNAGKTLNDTLRKRRADALEAGALVERQGMYEVTQALDFDSPQQAASFAAGTQVKDLRAWATKKGTPLEPATATPEAQAA